MSRFLLFVSFIAFVLPFTKRAGAQGNQTVKNGASTTAVNFPASGCIYQWTNDNPGIGLPASGTGNITAFTAVNAGNTPVTATITGIPVSSQSVAYVPNADEGTVLVISTSTHKTVATIKVGAGPFGVCLSPDRSRVYITNSASNDVSVIDATTNLVTATIPVGQSPIGVSVSPDGGTLYVNNDTSVSVINTQTLKKTANIRIGGEGNANAVSPDGTRLYACSEDTVRVINTATNTVVSSIGTGMAPWGVVVSPDGSKIYVANTFTPNVSVVSTKTNTVVASITVGVGPWGICLSPDGSRLYVANSGDNSTGPLTPGTVSVINTANNSVIATIPVGTYPIGVSVTPDGSTVYVLNNGGPATPGNISVINTATNMVSTINTGGNSTSTGNFILGGTSCTGTPITFTITVDPSPNIIAGTVTGNITACTGAASTSPNIQQFTVSGNNLTGDITAAAPAGFEISLAAGSGYGTTLTFPPTGGVVSNTVVYVRSAASANTGNLSGNVVLTSTGAEDQNVAVTREIGPQVSPVITITASANNICSGTPVTFTATPTNGGNAPVYQWRLNGISTGVTSAEFTSSTLANLDIITCVFTSNAACTVPATAVSNSIIMSVSAQVLPSVTIAASATHICYGTPVTFTATSANGGATPAYEWMVNGNNAGTNSPAFTSSTLANGDVVSCALTNTTSCTMPLNAASDGITITVDPLPVVNSGGNKTINIGSSTVLDATATGTIADITWSPATGLSNNKILNPVASPSVTTTYTLMVQTTDGCVAMDNATVTVLLPIVVPNAFTPNSDGINDAWNIKYLDAYSNCSVQVFNRWGQRLYSSIGYGHPWNGIYKGSALPTGTYYYIIDLKNNSKILSGYVAIIR